MARTATEKKHAAQDRILNGVANELFLQAESYESAKRSADKTIRASASDLREDYFLMHAQAVRVCKLFGVHSFHGIVWNGQPVYAPCFK